MKVFLMIDKAVVFDGEWETDSQATSTLLTVAQLLHNLGVEQGVRVIKQLDNKARAEQGRKAG